jgi:glycosyltransferase involved in cell wall biosynthesis
VRIAYLLASSELGGGNKVIFQHARLLEEGGDEVTILGDGPRPDWFSVTRWFDLSGGAAPPSQDLLVATYWTTIPRALALAVAPVAHFCQGYEGDFTHLAAQRGEIERCYREPLPALVVTPHLASLLAERFHREGRVVPPPIDRTFRPSRFHLPNRRPWIAVPGIFEADMKGVPTALAAIRALRERGVACRLLRFSPWPLSDPERAVLVADRELIGVPPAEIARALRDCDLLFFPARREEGFGLPLLEALASGLPAVASRIPSAEFMTDGAVPLVDAGNPDGFADAAQALLGDRGRWRRARERGLAAAERFAPERIAPLLADAVRWAAGAEARNRDT